MVEVRFQRVSKLVLLKVCVVVVVADLDRPIGGQQLRTRICLESQHCFKQQRVAHLGHAFHRSAIRRPLQTGDFQLEPHQLDAGGPVLDPFFAAVDVVLNAAQQLVADPVQLKLVNVVYEIVEPVFRLGLARLIKRLAV